MFRPGRLILAALMIAALGACSTDVPPTPTPNPTEPGPVQPTPDVPPPNGQTPSPPPFTPDPGVTTPEPTPLSEIEWRLGSDTSDFSVFDAIGGVTAVGATLVAVGTYEYDTFVGGAAWTSADGDVWHRAQTVPRGVVSALEDVILGPAGLVAVGWVMSGGTSLPTVWVSGDGLEWQAVEAGALDRGEMTAVAANAQGYVVLGFDPETEDGLAWTSSDGRNWGPPLTVPEFGVQPSINGLVALGQGFIAYGSSATDERAAMWVSLDGRAWRSVAELPAGPNSTVNGVATSGSQLVAVGASYLDEGTLALSWASADGLNWQSTLDVAAGETGEMLDVVPVDSGFLAVGSVATDVRTDLRAAVWSSSAGSNWQRLPDEPSLAQARMAYVVRAGPGLVVLGERAIDEAVEDFTPAAWLGFLR